MSHRSNNKSNGGPNNTSESIRVVVRLRPENNNDRNRYGKHCVSLTSNKSISLSRSLPTSANSGHANINSNNENDRNDDNLEKSAITVRCFSISPTN